MAKLKIHRLGLISAESDIFIILLVNFISSQSRELRIHRALKILASVTEQRCAPSEKQSLAVAVIRITIHTSFSRAVLLNL